MYIFYKLIKIITPTVQNHHSYGAESSPLGALQSLKPYLYLVSSTSKKPNDFSYLSSTNNKGNNFNYYSPLICYFSLILPLKRSNSYLKRFLSLPNLLLPIIKSISFSIGSISLSISSLIVLLSSKAFL